MSHSIHETIIKIQHFIFEKKKIGRAYVKQWCPEKSQNEFDVQILNKHTSQKDLKKMLSPCLSGNNIALITDAGCPGIADPGADWYFLHINSKFPFTHLWDLPQFFWRLWALDSMANNLLLMDIFRLKNRSANKPSKILNESLLTKIKPRFL